MSEGNGTAAVYVDDRASSQQRDALSAIASGQAGGPPALIFGRLIDEAKFLGVKFVPISFHKEGHKRGVSIPARYPKETRRVRTTPPRAGSRVEGSEP